VQLESAVGTRQYQGLTVAQGLQGLGVITVLGIGGLLFMTNPSLSAYGDFVAQEAIAFLSQDLCPTEHQTSAAVQQFFNEGCVALSANGPSEIKRFVTHNTQRQDFGVCSLYTTELPQHSLKVLGIFNQFFLLS
jgi:hypothetical protein